jgi:hypothetical protein
VSGAVRFAIKNRCGSQVERSGSNKFSSSPNLAIRWLIFDLWFFPFVAIAWLGEWRR